MIKTQNDAILNYLAEGYAITSREALEMFGCMRLASRINDLRARGHNIKTSMVSGKNKFGKVVSFAQYELEDSNDN